MEKTSIKNNYRLETHSVSFLDKKMHSPFPEPSSDHPLQLKWIIMKGDTVLVTKEGNALFIDFPGKDQDPISTTYLGIAGKDVLYLAQFNNICVPPNDCTFLNLREVFNICVDETLAHLAYAVQIAEFNINHAYCGRCGSITIESSVERARICNSCGLIVYPKICPAIIVLIIKEGSILLARSPGFRPGMYSIIAGFVEAGETIESAIIREVKEEVGISIQNIRYYASQPWPFPHSLMIGFIAEYNSGEIEIDNREIEDAKWFFRNSLPELPGPYSIAGKMIEKFKNGDI